MIVKTPVYRKLSEADVTICSIDCVVPELAARAINLSANRCQFKNSILFSDKELSGNFNFVKINKLSSVKQYNTFMLKEIAYYIKSRFVLIVQWDGYVVNGNLWDSAFLNYDYIGAIWPQHNDDMIVGNGGFSLRSINLLKSSTAKKFIMKDENEDDAICRTNRHLLVENHGLRFASPVIANIFSYEQVKTKKPTFGFHGCWNLLNHESDETVEYIILQLPDFYFSGIGMQRLIMNYYLAQNELMTKLIFSRMSKVMNYDHLSNCLIFNLGYDPNIVKRLIRFLKKTANNNKISNFFKLERVIK